MTVVSLTFNCIRKHADGQPRQWTAEGQERVMDPIYQELTPVVISNDAACPECGNTGVADYPTTVYVIPNDQSFADQVGQIRDAIDTESP